MALIILFVFLFVWPLMVRTNKYTQIPPIIKYIDVNEISENNTSPNVTFGDTASSVFITPNTTKVDDPFQS